MSVTDLPPALNSVPADLDADDQTLLGGSINWSPDIVKAIHKVVFEESMRIRVAAQFLPHTVVPPKTTSVPPNLITASTLDAPIAGIVGNSTLTIDEGITIRLIEIWIEFALTDSQVTETREAANPETTSAVALARRAAQYLALAQDRIVFQGVQIYNNPDSFFSQFVRYRPGQQPLDGGLSGLSLQPNSATSPNGYTLYTGLPVNGSTPAGPNPYQYVNAPIPVETLTSPPPGVTYGENTLFAVTSGISQLTDGGNPGPFALVLDTFTYADLYAPAGPESLAITADRVGPMMKAGIYSTNALPALPVSPPPPATPVPPPASSGVHSGVIVSVGANAVDLVVGQHARTRWQQKDANGNHRFRVLDRFALRVSDLSAVVPLVFLSPAAAAPTPAPD